MNNYSKELEIALHAARSAAEVVIKNFHKTKQTNVKDGGKGLVTQTDLEADRAISEVLGTNSEYPVLSEESGQSGESGGPMWVVDPLDGTNNFARSIPLFTVSVGLMNGNESLVGVIIDPVNQKEYYAVKGGGAFCNGEQLVLPNFDTEYIPMLFLNHGYARIDRERFKNVTGKVAANYNTLKLGSTALELCYVANGSVDAFITSGDELWDFAAGAVIAAEAGCKFTDWQGNPWDGKAKQLLFARPEIQPQLLDVLRKL